jgi:hypothetical protein
LVTSSLLLVIPGATPIVAGVDVEVGTSFSEVTRACFAPGFYRIKNKIICTCVDNDMVATRILTLKQILDLNHVQKVRIQYNKCGVGWGGGRVWRFADCRRWGCVEERGWRVGVPSNVGCCFFYLFSNPL